jgi:hypothetical protein
MKATDLLHQDHAAIAQLIDDAIDASDEPCRQQVLRTLAARIEIHGEIEEEFFYPPLAGLSGVIPEARREHAQMQALLGDISRHEPGSPDVMLEIGRLRDVVQRHVAEEEGAIFAAAERLGVDELGSLGERLGQRHGALLAAAGLAPVRTPHAA